MSILAMCIDNSGFVVLVNWLRREVAPARHIDARRSVCLFTRKLQGGKLFPGK
jgi:hypothetical protein